MTIPPTSRDTQSALDRQAAHATCQAFVQEQIRRAIRATFIDILEAEVTQFIGAERYELDYTPLTGSPALPVLK
jgi:hypothetical protein